MIKAAPLTLRDHIRNIVKACDDDDAAIQAARDATKGRLEDAQNDHGIDASAMRRLLAWRRAKAKDPAKRLMSDELDDQYRFLCEGGMGIDIPEAADTEIERVMALTNTTKPPKIAVIRKELGCSQGKAHKLRSLAAARLAMRAQVEEKSSSSSVRREHEHLPKHDLETGEIKEAALPGDDAGHRGEPSSPAEQSVEPVPSSGRVSPIIDSGEGRQSGTHSNPMPSSAPVAASGNEDLGVAAGAGPFGSQETTEACGGVEGHASEDTAGSGETNAACNEPEGVIGKPAAAGIESGPQEPSAERPALQEVGAGSSFAMALGAESIARREAKHAAADDDLTIPAHLDQRKRQVHA